MIDHTCTVCARQENGLYSYVTVTEQGVDGRSDRAATRAAVDTDALRGAHFKITVFVPWYGVTSACSTTVQGP